MLPLASTAIYISQLCIPPPAGLPVAAVVIAAYVTTVAHPAGALYLVFQALATAAITGVYYLIFAAIGFGLNNGLQALISRRAGDLLTIPPRMETVH